MSFQQDFPNSIEGLISELFKSNHFYSSKFSKGEISIPPKNYDEFFKKIPFTTRDELEKDQIRNPPCGSNLTYSRDYYKKIHQTSGSSGTPLFWLDTLDDWSHCIDARLKIFRRFGITSSDRIMFAFRFGPFTGSYGSFEAGVKLGAFCIMGGAISDHDRLKMMLQHDITVMVATPSTAMKLGFLKAGLNEPSSYQLKHLVIIGEPGGSILQTRLKLQELWGDVIVHDYYGITETGAVGYQCPVDQTRMHLLSDYFFAEVITPSTGLPTPPNELGELVLTSLKRRGQPVVRYRTCDLVVPSADKICKCGSKEPTILGGIQARVDNIAILDGINIYPALIEATVLKCPQVIDYRVFVRKNNGLMNVSIGILAKSENNQLALSEVSKIIKDTFPTLEIPVNIIEKLEVTDGKNNRWVLVD